MTKEFAYNLAEVYSVTLPDRYASFLSNGEYEPLQSSILRLVDGYVRGDFRVDFTDPNLTDLESLGEDQWIDEMDSIDWQGDYGDFVPLATLEDFHADEDDDPVKSFLVVMVSKPECPIMLWDYDGWRLYPLSKSFDDFLGGVAVGADYEFSHDRASMNFREFAWISEDEARGPSVEETIEAAKRSEARELDLSDQDLESVPQSLWELTQLEKLSLCDNSLSTLPPEIGRLENLRELDISDNPITELPPEIGNLTKLQFLNLGSLEITSLPPQIGHLANLEKLWAKYSKLESLPGEIGMLAKLNTLRVGGARSLAKLPPEIGALQSLKHLELESTALKTLPLEFGNLKGLEELELGSVQFSAVPEALAGLTGLKSVSFHQAALPTLPAAFFELPSLEKVDLAFTEIEDLPAEVLKLRRLRHFKLKHTKAGNVPKDVCKAGLDAVAKHFGLD